jgi:hypothetical protein
MPHVTFIHGIGNKPEADKLLNIWQRSLADNMGIDLGGEGITSSMVYWADVLYAAPDPNIAAYESTEESTSAAVDAVDNPGAPQAASSEEAAFIASLALKLGGTLAAVETVEAVQPERKADLANERIPLPWFVKKAFLENFLRDVHHYLFDTKFSPRPGTAFQVQKEIRQRFVSQLQSVPDNKRPHVVISHSMGTVIAYDCLKRVPECPVVDGFMTIGSPLGLDEIQDKLQPGWTRANGFPSSKLVGRWHNVFDRLDPVAGFDPFIKNDYQKDSDAVVDDIYERNTGAWRHSIVKYMGGSQLRASLRSMLEL